MINDLKIGNEVNSLDSSEELEKESVGSISFKNNRRRHNRKLFVKGVIFTVIAAISGGITATLLVEYKFKSFVGSYILTSPYVSSESPTNPIPKNYVNQVVETVGMAVVGVSTSADSFSSDNLYRQTVSIPDIDSSTMGIGSGIVFDSENGYIITNYQIIAGSSKIFVKLPNGNSKPYEAKLKYHDKATGLAIIKIDVPRLIAAKFGDSDRLRVGDNAVAIGDAKGESSEITANAGVISCINKFVEYKDPNTGKSTGYYMLQTDAGINIYNNGGPLCNAYGDIIGINTVYMKQVGDSIAFAIESNEALKVINAFRKIKPSLGVEAGAAKSTSNNKGVEVESIIPGIGAEASGIRPKDIIVEIAGTKVNKYTDIEKILEKHNIGDIVRCKILRAGKEIELNVLLLDPKNKD